MVDIIVASGRADYRRLVELLESGARPDYEDVSGWTPLHEAARNGRDDNIRILLAAGAIPSTNSIGINPLHPAARRGHIGAVQLLLDAGVDPNAPDDFGSTPLHEAATNNHEDVVRLLLDYEADPTLVTRRGNTPAQSTRDPEIKALLEDAEYTWTHPWTLDEHTRWRENQRLERVGALSAFGEQPRRRTDIPFLPREIQYSVLEQL